MSVDWSQGGSQGKCMWWGIMISCTYPSGFPTATWFKGTLVEVIRNHFKSMILCPLGGNSLTIWQKAFFRGILILCACNAKQGIGSISKPLMSLIHSIQPGGPSEAEASWKMPWESERCLSSWFPVGAFQKNMQTNESGVSSSSCHVLYLVLWWRFLSHQWLTWMKSVILYCSLIRITELRMENLWRIYVKTKRIMRLNLYFHTCYEYETETL